MVFLDLHLYCLKTITNRESFLSRYASNINYIYNLSPEIQATLIQCSVFNDTFTLKRAHFEIINTKNELFGISAKLIKLVLHKKPDVILMHGMRHPLAIICVKLWAGQKTKVLIQNHADKPYSNRLKRFFQKRADQYIAGYLFVSKTQAKAWHNTGVIKETSKVYEVMEGSTTFVKQNKEISRTKLGLEKQCLFLWVGRLDANKDPFTVLNAFVPYVKFNPNAIIWMIYTEGELEKEVKEFIQTNSLQKNVILKGKIQNPELEWYYSAADYFILASHEEGSGYALCEAMACGCIPVVTRIPSFNKMLQEGTCGYQFEPGNHTELLTVLSNLGLPQYNEESEKVLTAFETNLSFKAIGGRITEIALSLSGK